jgi:hypothetical protein
VIIKLQRATRGNCPDERAPICDMGLISPFDALPRLYKTGVSTPFTFSDGLVYNKSGRSIKSGKFRVILRAGITRLVCSTACVLFYISYKYTRILFHSFPPLQAPLIGPFNLSIPSIKAHMQTNMVYKSNHSSRSSTASKAGRDESRSLVTQS